MTRKQRQRLRGAVCLLLVAAAATGASARRKKSASLWIDLGARGGADIHFVTDLPSVAGQRKLVRVSLERALGRPLIQVAEKTEEGEWRFTAVCEGAFARREKQNAADASPGKRETTSWSQRGAALEASASGRSP